MRLCLLLFCWLFLQQVMSQEKGRIVYEVSGIIQDTTKIGVPGVTVKLVSANDTLKVSTDSEGIFFFDQVKSPVFILTISHLGFTTTYRKYLFTNANKRLVLDPVILKTDEQMLNEVKIKGKTGIIYKKDTVEYRAGDYKVREYANLAELLKKMEGIEVDKLGKVSHNGAPVLAAKFNGKRYFDGNISQAIKELPADIVERIQIIDDYGEQAELTGIKTGQSVKMLNVVSKSDKSVGNLAELATEAGNDKRYGFLASGRQINGTRQLSLKAQRNQDQAGVATAQGSDLSDVSGGIIQRTAVDFILSDQLNKKSSFELGYKFDQNDNNNEKNSNSTELFDQGTVNSIYSNNNTRLSNMHRLNTKMAYSPDLSNQLVTALVYTHNDQRAKTLLSVDRSGLIRTGQHQNRDQHSKNALYDLSSHFVHKFKADNQVFSIQFKYSNDNNDLGKNEINRLFYYDADILKKDSLLHLGTSNVNVKHTLYSKAIYVQPLSSKQKLNFSVLLNRKRYDNKKATTVIDEVGFPKLIDSLSDAFEYRFLESQMDVSYRYDNERVTLSVGLSLIPTLLSGQSADLISRFSRSKLNLVPVFNFKYNFSRYAQINLSYRAANIEPTFEQLQPVYDPSDLLNTVIGNRNLSAAFMHSLSASYNKYFTSSGINLNANVFGSIIRNRIVRNILIIPDSLNAIKRETSFINANGDYSINANYYLSKNFDGGVLGLRYSGLAYYNSVPLFNNNIKKKSDDFRVDQKIEVQMNVLKWMELNQKINFSTQKSSFGLSNNRSFYQNNLAFILSGNVYFSSNTTFDVDVAKNYLSGIEAYMTRSPLVINAGFSKRMFSRKNAVVALKAYDVLKQNNFLSRKMIDNGITDSRTNSLTRYLMISFSWAPQKWTGSKNTGRIRNGDGSFRP
jgi:hypothetical protein